jgi:hypothetical protein
MKKEFKSWYEEWMYYRKEWEKKYHYEEVYTCTCPRCLFYCLNESHSPEKGKCILMMRAGTGGCSEVSCQGVCDRFISTMGSDINGKDIIPSVEQ